MTDKAEPKSEENTDIEAKTTKAVTAKAGKRSAKSIAEAEAKQAKQVRKSSSSTAQDIKTKPAPKKTRTLLERRSKSYKEKSSLLDSSKTYSLEEASELIGKTNPVKFDATVELHLRLAVDPRQADQNIRDNVMLPSGSGKNIRVAVFTDSANEKMAIDAGADLVGESKVIKELEAGSFSFDVLISSPDQMAKLGKYARILGPRGLMPNPKSGTVTTDIAKAVSESKAGRVEYRVDSGGNLHIPVGKVSFTPAKLLSNLNAVLDSVKANKPASIKSTYLISAHLTTSMGPSLRLAL